MTLAESLERLYQRKRQQLFDCALSVVRCPMLAEDAVHDAFVKLFALREEPRNLKSYAFRAVRNAALDLVRRQTRVAEESVESIQEAPHETHGAWEGGDNRDQLKQALADLSDDEQEVILLHLWSDLKFREIACVVDRPLGTVVSLYRRGLEKMRLQLTKEHERFGTSVKEYAAANSERQSGREDCGLAR